MSTGIIYTNNKKLLSMNKINLKNFNDYYKIDFEIKHIPMLENKGIVIVTTDTVNNDILDTFELWLCKKYKESKHYLTETTKGLLEDKVVKIFNENFKGKSFKTLEDFVEKSLLFLKQQHNEDEDYGDLDLYDDCEEGFDVLISVFTMLQYDINKSKIIKENGLI